MGPGGEGGVGEGSRILPDTHCAPGLLLYDARMKHCFMSVLMFHDTHWLLLAHRAQHAAMSVVSLMISRMGFAASRHTP